MNREAKCIDHNKACNEREGGKKVRKNEILYKSMNSKGLMGIYLYRVLCRAGNELGRTSWEKMEMVASRFSISF